jgi:hypothetical protein
MKLHKILFIICLVVVGFVSVFLTQHSGAQEQNQQAYDIACEVKDVATLKDCVQQAKEGKYNLIKIAAIVECTSKEDCAVDLSNIDISLKIYGINNTDTGFKRTGQFDYSLFTLKNTKSIVIGSFLIDDSSEGNCSALGSPCPPAMLVESSKNNVIDQLRTRGVKNTGVSIVSSENIVIKNSVFQASQNHGVVVTNGDSKSSNIQLEQNTFTDSSATALVFAASDGTNSIIKNTFQHNHREAIYGECTGICNASQLHIMANTKNILIANNTISGGLINLYNPFGLYASGIEIASELVENATLRCNTISNNTGNGIVIPDRAASSKSIELKQNAIFDNGIDLNVATTSADQIGDNCFSSSCKIAGC